MDLAFLSQLQNALTAVQIVQCLQTAREELEKKHLPAQMAQLASYFAGDPNPLSSALSDPTLFNQENVSTPNNLTPFIKPQLAAFVHPLDMSAVNPFENSEQAMSDSNLGSPISPVSHLPVLRSTWKDVNQPLVMNEKNMTAMNSHLQALDSCIRPALQQQVSSTGNLNEKVEKKVELFKESLDTSGKLAFESNEAPCLADLELDNLDDANNWIEKFFQSGECDAILNQTDIPTVSFSSQNEPSQKEVHQIIATFEDNETGYSNVRYDVLNNGDGSGAGLGCGDGENATIGEKRKRYESTHDCDKLSNQANPLTEARNFVSIESVIANSCKNTRPRQPRGTATDPQSVSARKRRERISKKIRTLQEMVPNARSMDTASMLEQAIHYVHSLEEKIARLKRRKN